LDSVGLGWTGARFATETQSTQRAKCDGKLLVAGRLQVDEFWQVVGLSGKVEFEPRHLGCYEDNGVERAGKGARWRRLTLCYGMIGFHHGTVWVTVREKYAIVI